MEILRIGLVGAGSAIATRPLSQTDVHALTEEIQGASTGPQLQALGRRLRAYSSTATFDLVHRARLAKLMLALRTRLGQLDDSAA
jgi:hypothetical protein